MAGSEGAYSTEAAAAVRRGYDGEKNESIICRVKRELRSAAVRERFRVQVTDFTRERVVTGPIVLILMLRGQKVSLQTAVNKFFSAVGEVWRGVTASAYRQARQKVQPEVFVHLKAVTCEEYYARYGPDGEVGVWQGQRVGGVEGFQG
jgi:hypothetical protein